MASTNGCILTVGIDIDNVIADYIGKASEYIWEEFKIPKERYIHEYNGIWKIKANGRPLGEYLFGEWREDILRGSQLMDGAKDGYRMFQKDPNKDVYIVTSRGQDSEDITREWLKKHNITDYESLIFTKNKLEAPCQVLIDDHPKHIQNYLDHTRMGICITHPYNKDQDFPYRAKNLKKAYHLLSNYEY